MSTIAVNAITDANAGNTTTINGVTPNSANVVGKNRIINGNMMIDQRNAGASVTQTVGDVFPVDRWNITGTVTSKFTAEQNAASVTPPAGFANYLGMTSSSAYTVGAAETFLVRQKIEGFNTADLSWGTASAKTVTLSFWVRSSLTGTFGGALVNSNSSRCYPFSYTISVANTWEQKTVTIEGDTSGTWVGATNAIGINVSFSLGTGATYSSTAGAWTGSVALSATGATSVVGTSGATWYITGVQLEVGESATEFEHRPYTTELQLCQRYYFRTGATAGYATLAMGYLNTNTACNIVFQFPVAMRASPSGSFSGCRIRYQAGNGTISATTGVSANTTSCEFKLSTSSIPTGYPVALQTNANASDHVAFSAEL
jgi:hypothetical protein